MSPNKARDVAASARRVKQKAKKLAYFRVTVL
jgi:hypothetical protein